MCSVVEVGGDEWCVGLCGLNWVLFYGGGLSYPGFSFGGFL